MLASQYGIVIDRAIGAPGHGKDIFDGLNATDKRFLQGKMCIIGSPEANDDEKRMADHSMVDGAANSFSNNALGSVRMKQYYVEGREKQNMQIVRMKQI